MAVSCYSFIGLSPEDIKKKKAVIASQKSKMKKAMQPYLDEIQALDPHGLGVTGQKALDDLTGNVITHTEYKEAIEKLHAAAKADQAAQAVALAQAHADTAAKQLDKAKDLDAKAKANLASKKSKAKKKALEAVQELHGAGYVDEAIQLDKAIDNLVAGTLSPQELLDEIAALKKVQTAPPSLIPTPSATAPPAQAAPSAAPTAWQDQWAKDSAKKGGQVSAKNYPWAKDEWMQNHPSATHSPFVQEKGAQFPNMSPQQAQVVKAAQGYQLEFPIVDVDLAKAEFVPTQHGGLVDIVSKYVKKMPDDKFPRAYVWKGQYHLTNGHHRIMAGYIRGDALATVQVIDLDQMAGKGLWSGSLQDLVNSLDPPPSAVPSAKISKSAQSKFGSKPVSSGASPPVPAQAPFPTGGVSGVAGGFTVPASAKAGSTLVNDLLAQANPAFASAADAKKAAKKLANNKFYAKKKVELAIDQAKALQNPALEKALQGLYDDIVAGKIVTDAKAVMKLIADTKAIPAAPTLSPADVAKLAEAEDLVKQMDAVGIAWSPSLDATITSAKAGQVIPPNLDAAIATAKSDLSIVKNKLANQAHALSVKAGVKGAPLQQINLLALQNDIATGVIPLGQAKATLDDLALQIDSWLGPPPKSPGSLASAKSIAKKKVEQAAAQTTDPNVKAALDHLAWQIKSGNVVVQAGSEANGLISAVTAKALTPAAVTPPAKAIPTPPSSATTVSKKAAEDWGFEMTAILDKASSEAYYASKSAAMTLDNFYVDAVELKNQLIKGTITVEDFTKQADILWENINATKWPSDVDFTLPPKLGVPVSTTPIPPKAPTKQELVEWGATFKDELFAAGEAGLELPDFTIGEMIANTTSEISDKLDTAIADMLSGKLSPAEYKKAVDKLWDEAYALPLPGGMPLSPKLSGGGAGPIAGTGQVIIPTDVKSLIQAAPATGKVSSAPYISTQVAMADIENSLQPWQKLEFADRMATASSIPTTKVKLTATKFKSAQGEFDAGILKKAAGGDLKTGRPVLIKDGDTYIIVSGGETITGRIAAGVADVDARVIDLDLIKASPKPAAAPDYWAVPKPDPTAPYQSEAFKSAQAQAADKWLHERGSMTYTKTRDVAKTAKKDPRYQAALAKAGLTDWDFENLIDNAIIDWNGNSSRSPQMVAFHMAAADEFGLDPAHFRLTENFAKTRKKAEKLLATNSDIYRVIVRAMYDNTQAQFKAAGITHVSLWRGYGFKKSTSVMPDEFKNYLVGDKFAHENQALPLQSWASVSGTARSFGSGKDWGYLTRAEVPVEQVMASGVTGFGTGTSEHEFILLSGPGTVWHEVLHRPDNKRRRKP